MRRSFRFGADLMTVSAHRAGLAFAALLAAAGCASKSPPPPPPPPQVGVVTLGLEPVTLTTELPGRIAAAETSEVRPQVSGIIRSRLFEEGSVVAKGQLLYVIEDAPYRAALVSAQGQLARAQAAIASTQAQAARYGQLVGINAVSRQEADNAGASAGQARADVIAGRGTVQSARVNLGFTRIRAPIGGRIGRSLVTVGALVQTGQTDPLATIQNLGFVYVDIPQSAADLIALRQELAQGTISRQSPATARVRLVLPDGSLYPVEGALQFSEVTVEPTTGAVTLRARFPNPQGLLLPGLFVRARVIEGIKQQALLAPQQGVSRDERGRPTALVVGARNKVEMRRLTVDRAIGNRWIVTGGLRAGDRLIVEGLSRLQPGTVVRPAPPQRPIPPAQAG